MAARLLLLLLLLRPAQAHGDPKDWPINPELGVSGFPDCSRIHPERELTMEQASFDLQCAQRRGPATAKHIACIGDSITAGVHSSGGIHPYPAQLQILLDKSQGKVRDPAQPAKAKAA